MCDSYGVVIYYDYNLVELIFDNINEAVSYYKSHIKNIKKNEFKGFIIELHSKDSGLIMRHVENIEFYNIQ